MTDETLQPRKAVFSEADKADALKCFEHARKVSESKNYEYAIELYLHGLARWPEAVDEGLRTLRVVATARRMAEKKGPGFFEVRKFPLNGKDARKNLLNALHLFALDPTNNGYLEGILVNAARAGCFWTVHWGAPLFWEAFSTERKVSPARCDVVVKALDLAGEQFKQDEEFHAAADVYRVQQLVADLWKQHHLNSAEAAKAVSNASSNLTIVKGRFGTTEDFRGSLKDAAGARDLHDQHRAVQEETRLQQLIRKAREEYEADPNTPGKLFALVELMTRHEEEADESSATALLDKAFANSSNYNFKLRADEIRMRQLRRGTREALARLHEHPQDAACRAVYEVAHRGQLDAEIAIYKERSEHYPTDLRHRFELGRRYVEARRFDEAIPLLQQAQSDPRRRDEARLYIGLCLFEKRFYRQATETLEAARKEHAVADDDLGKALSYWLARSHEAAGESEPARGVYGQLIQIDYNYRDARQRLERLSAGPKPP